MGRLRRSAFWQLGLANVRELIRDRMTFFFVLVFPFLFMFLFLFISNTSKNARYKVGLITPDNPTSGVTQLAGAFHLVSGLDVRDTTPSEAEAFLKRGSVKAIVRLPIDFNQGVIQISAASDAATQAAFVQAILADLTRPPGGAAIESTVTTKAVDPLEYGLPGVLVLAFFSLALMGTMAPVIQMRERGSLRVLGLTPLSRGTFIAAHVAARFILGLCQLAAMLVIASAMGKLPAGSVMAIAGVSSLSLLMLFALSYALSGVIPSAEVANGLGGGLMAPLLMFCGILMPFEAMPEWVPDVARFVPVTYVGDLLRHLLIKTPTHYPVWASVLVMVGSTVVFSYIAVLTFKWDRRSEKRKGVLLA